MNGEPGCNTFINQTNERSHKRRCTCQTKRIKSSDVTQSDSQVFSSQLSLAAKFKLEAEFVSRAPRERVSNAANLSLSLSPRGRTCQGGDTVTRTSLIFNHDNRAANQIRRDAR